MCSIEYQEFGKYLRTLIKQELTSGNYPNFRSPSSHVCSYPDFANAKFRFDILPRPNVAAGNGKHDFYVGHLEISLFIAALSKNNSFANGVVFPKSSPNFRLVPGIFASVEPLPEAIMESIASERGYLCNTLFSGDYNGFVKRTMEAVHEPIYEFKEFCAQKDFLR